jgi:hypothetical protein
MSLIDWILFDLGGVLVEVEQSRIFNHLEALTGIPAPEVGERLKASPFFRDEFIVKEFAPAEIVGHVNAILGKSLPTADVVHAINAELGAEISTTADLLPALQRKPRAAEDDARSSSSSSSSSSRREEAQRGTIVAGIEKNGQ